MAMSKSRQPRDLLGCRSKPMACIISRKMIIPIKKFILLPILIFKVIDGFLLLVRPSIILHHLRAYLMEEII